MLVWDSVPAVLARNNWVENVGAILKHTKDDPDSDNYAALKPQVSVITCVSDFEKQNDHDEEAEPVDDVEENVVCDSECLVAWKPQVYQKDICAVHLPFEETADACLRLLSREHGIENWKEDAEKSIYRHRHEEPHKTPEENLVFFQVRHFLKLSFFSEG